MKRLTRTNDRIVGGVCGGIAKYLSQTEKEIDEDTPSAYEVDPTFIRIGWAMLTLFGFGIGVLLYLILWAIVPEE